MASSKKVINFGTNNTTNVSNYSVSDYMQSVSNMDKITLIDKTGGTAPLVPIKQYITPKPYVTPIAERVWFVSKSKHSGVSMCNVHGFTTSSIPENVEEMFIPMDGMWRSVQQYMQFIERMEYLIVQGYDDKPWYQRRGEAFVILDYFDAYGNPKTGV